MELLHKCRLERLQRAFFLLSLAHLLRQVVQLRLQLFRLFELLSREGNNPKKSANSIALWDCNRKFSMVAQKRKLLEVGRTHNGSLEAKELSLFLM